MSLKVLLLSPPIFDFYYSFHRSEPLGLLYIKEALSQYDWLHVDIYDARYNASFKVIQTPSIFRYLDTIYTNDTSWFSLLKNFKRFGHSFKRIVSFIKEHVYDVVCISSLFSAYHYDIEMLVKRIKEETGVIVIVGGWAVWAYDEYVCNGYADIYVKGDGEVALAKILYHIYLYKNRALPKIFEDEGCNSHFFIHEFPKRSSFYTYYGKRIANVVCSKGCVWQCNFCSIHLRYRFVQRNIDSIRSEFEYLYRSGVEIVNFEDDNFLFNKRFASQLLSLMKYYYSKGMKFLCMNGVTTTNLLPVLKDALDAGFVELNCSLVSSHEAVVNKYNRPALKEIIKTIAWQSVSKVRFF